MEIQYWVISQIVIDMTIAGLLVWFVINHVKRKKAKPDTSELFNRTENILNEMRSLSLQLEKNLEEKKDLSNTILSRLEKGLKKAEESRKELNKIVVNLGTNSPDSAAHFDDSAQLRSSINNLLTKGLSREEVAQNLGISVGEIDLHMKLYDHLNISG